ncbi:hypothetical protein [Amycolatopsis pretoriensis]|uniref:hypothetical protein n=1 Tax=Amycolatopsis pretoriensis TaxID=218821 RepID=UPI00115FFF53|nr:hypothetical protein [Amycolatopsis pretoriensis]
MVELAREFDLSLSWTGALLRQLGADVSKTGRGIKCQLDESTIVAQYDSGLTVRAVAELKPRLPRQDLPAAQGRRCATASTRRQALRDSTVPGVNDQEQ